MTVNSSHWDENDSLAKTQESRMLAKVLPQKPRTVACEKADEVPRKPGEVSGSRCCLQGRNQGNATMEFVIPMPPSTNRIWRRSGSQMHKSSEYTKWLRTAGYMIMAQKPKGITGPYKLSIAALRPDRRRRDIDNLIKPTSDLLQSVGVIEDDSDCEMVTARWVTEGPPFCVRVEPAGVQ